MGLGKTLQALALAHYYVADWPLLIVTPSSVKYAWNEAIRVWLPSVPLHHIQVEQALLRIISIPNFFYGTGSELWKRLY